MHVMPRLPDITPEAGRLLPHTVAESLTMDPVTFERHGAVALLTIANPGLKNALNHEIALGIRAVCDEVDADESIGSMVVRGHDGTFCSGADTRDWANTYNDPGGDETYRSTDVMYGSFVRVGQVKVPTIAAVRGAAVGAGLNLALATDLRIVADNARIMAGFLRAGIHPGGGFFTISSRLSGREAAAALGIFSEEINGTRAVEIGLAWQSLPDPDVESRALELADRVGQDPELSRRSIRSFRLQTDGPRLEWNSALEMERGVQMWSQARRLRLLEKSAQETT
jgi:enoyl-CoA hydratase